MGQPQNIGKIPESLTGYNDLKYYFSGLHALFSIRSFLAIDMMTATSQEGMPRRLSDIANMTKRVYAETTSPTVTKLLEHVENQAAAKPGALGEWDMANLREMRRIHNHLSALMPELYISSVHVSNEGRKRHRAVLDGAGNWQDVQGYMQQVVELYRRVADQKQKKFNASTPYNALLLGYASDIEEAQMDRLYDMLEKPLRDLRTKVLDKQAGQPAPMPLEGNFTRGDQMWLNKTVLEMMGFDFARGGLFVTALSPLCGGTPDDVRILVRCGNDDTFLDSLSDTLYQGARGLYMQNVPAEWKSQPVGQDMGALMMNAMSLLYETIIGRTPQFFDFIAVRAEGVFRQFRNRSFEPENLYRLKKMVSNTPRRNEADEMSKIFHDLMRYRIEKDLIGGRLAVKDLPERWNEESRKLLGVAPQNLLDGPLQNPDWFTGRFGFIPTNTLSHIMAAELHAKMYAENNALPQQIEHGNLAPVNEWLKERIHSKGRSMGAMEVMGAITGRELDTRNLMEHLERRYLSDKR